MTGKAQDRLYKGPKALYMDIKQRSYDNKWMVWGEYPIDKVKGFEEEIPFTDKHPVLFSMLALVTDSRGKALEFMKDNLRK